MKKLTTVAWLETKLLLREPLTVLFALFLPLMVLFIMGAIFGDGSHGDLYRQVDAMSYYVPAYVTLVPASIGLISLPTMIASNRERGVFRRYRASSMPAWVAVGAQILVALVLSVAGAVLLLGVALPVQRVAAPESPLTVLAAFLLVSLTFGSLGVLLGAVLPSAGAAQGLGVMLWFAMLVVGGAGPPPEILTGAMAVLRDLIPLRHAIWTVQDGWLGLDAGASWLVTGLLVAAAAGLSVRLFRWE